MAPRSAIVFLLCFFAFGAQADGRITQKSFYDWDYAVWVWSNLKTGDAYDAEWAKYKEATQKWEKSGHKSGVALDEHPQASLIKKGLDLGNVYKWWSRPYTAEGSRSGLWEVYEPNCYEGEDTYSIIYADNGFKTDDLWSRVNIFTGKCDWPDWRVPEQVAFDKEKKAKFMAHLEKRRDYIEKRRREMGR